MNDVYKRGRHAGPDQADLTGSRSWAVDFSGATGSPMTFAMVDEIMAAGNANGNGPCHEVNLANCTLLMKSICKRILLLSTRMENPCRLLYSSVRSFIL